MRRDTHAPGEFERNSCMQEDLCKSVKFANAAYMIFWIVSKSGSVGFRDGLDLRSNRKARSTLTWAVFPVVCSTENGTIPPPTIRTPSRIMFPHCVGMILLDKFPSL
jgi:hypothetical protein